MLSLNYCIGTDWIYTSYNTSLCLLLDFPAQDEYCIIKTIFLKITCISSVCSCIKAKYLKKNVHIQTKI